MTAVRRALRRLLVSPFVRYRTLGRIARRLALDEGFVRTLIEDELFAFRIKTERGVGGAFRKLLLDPDVLQIVLSDERVQTRISMNGAMIRRMARDELYVEAIIQQEESQWKLRHDSRALTAALADAAYVEKVVVHELFGEALRRQPRLLERLLGEGAGSGSRVSGLDSLSGSPPTAATLEITGARTRVPGIAKERGVDPTGPGANAVMERATLWQYVLTAPRIAATLLRDGGVRREVAGYEGLGEALLEEVPGLERLLARLPLDAIVGNPYLLDRVVRDERVFERIAGDEVVLSKLLLHGRVIDKIACDELVLGRLLGQERTIEHLRGDDRLLGEVLASESALDRLLARGEVVGRVAAHPRVLGRIKSDPALLEKLADDQQTVEKLVSLEAVQNAVLTSPAILETIIARPLVDHEKGVRERMLAVLEFDRVWERLARHRPPMTPEREGRLVATRAKLEGVGQVPDALLGVVCDDDEMVLANGRLQFPDRRSLWVLVNEILGNEEYYFETKTNAPRVLDCGTHFGLAVYYFKTLFKRARIIGFEPVPYLRDFARRNVESNGYRDVEILPYALGSEDGTARFCVNQRDSMGGALASRSHQAEEDRAEIQVEVRRLSHYLDEPVHFLKLDVEGAEDDVLREAAPKLRNVQQLFCEYHHGPALPGGRLREIVGLLEERDFDVSVSKSLFYQRTTQMRPLKYVGNPHSLAIWAKNRNWMQA